MANGADTAYIDIVTNKGGHASNDKTCMYVTSWKIMQLCSNGTPMLRESAA